VLRILRKEFPTMECALLSTCNRAELYACEEENLPDVQKVNAALADFKGLNAEELVRYLYVHRGREAARHLFRVTAGLDSMVLGETEIKGQVEAAYFLAKNCGATGKMLNRLFESSLRAAKEVHSVTRIGVGKVSVSSVAVDFARKVFQNFSDKTVMVIGAGQAGEATLTNLLDRGVSRVIIANRSPERAAELARKYGGKAIALELMEDYLPRADIVIASTGARGHIIEPEHIRSAMRTRRNKPMLLLDIAVPRDINPAVNDIQNVYLFDIDDLKEAAEDNRRQREAEVGKCLEIIDRHIDSCMKAIEGMKVAPTIAKLSETVHNIMEAELARTLPKLGNLSEREKNEIRHMADRIVHKILHGPVQTLTEKTRDGEGHWYVEVIRKLFRLSE